MSHYDEYYEDYYNDLVKQANTALRQWLRDRGKTA